jgi:hypothetical protein
VDAPYKKKIVYVGWQNKVKLNNMDLKGANSEGVLKGS